MCKYKTGGGDREALEVPWLKKGLSHPSWLSDKCPPDVEEKEKPCRDGNGIRFPIRFS